MKEKKAASVRALVLMKKRKKAEEATHRRVCDTDGRANRFRRTDAWADLIEGHARSYGRARASRINDNTPLLHSGLSRTDGADTSQSYLTQPDFPWLLFQGPDYSFYSLLLRPCIALIERRRRRSGRRHVCAERRRSRNLTTHLMHVRDNLRVCMSLHNTIFFQGGPL